jgi:hypothetical protein
VRYSSAAGIEFHTGNGITIERCNVSYIGGEWLNYEDASLTRLGNGISLAQSNDSIIVRYCRASQCFDAGISPQAWSANAMTNMWFYGNIITNCYYSFEFWANSTYTLTNIHFFNNTCYNAGYCWSYDIPLQRGDNSFNACHLMSWSLAGTASDIYIRNNIFANSRNWAYRLDDNLNKIVCDYNLIYADTVGYTAETTIYITLAQWQAAVSQEAHSISANPLMRPGTFRLKDVSPAIDAGTSAGYTVDIYGHKVPQNSVTDIGACEYGNYVLFYGGKQLY